MPLTRRSFAGIFAMGSTAFAKTTGFIEHKILRRPYTWESKVIEKDGYQWRRLSITIRHDAPVRIRVGSPGRESLAEMMVKPTPSLGPYHVQSVVGLDAGVGLVVRIESAREFKFFGLRSEFVIRQDRINKWVREHSQSLGGDSDMGPTWVTETI